MAGAKETPRQKMIGMMYLVLTALLALNISKEILNGFVKVENGLRKTDQTVQGKSRETMLEFEAKYLQDQQKVKPYYDAAKDIEKKADDLYDHITQLKANEASSSFLLKGGASSTLKRWVSAFLIVKRRCFSPSSLLAGEASSSLKRRGHPPC